MLKIFKFFKKEEKKYSKIQEIQKTPEIPNSSVENWEIKYLEAKLEASNRRNKEAINKCCSLSKFDNLNANTFISNNGDYPDRVKLYGMY